MIVPVPSLDSMGALCRRAAAMAVLALLAAGCSQQTLYSKLDEREANDEVALLRNAGISANKVARDAAYAVTVPDADMARATQILREQGLPRRSFDSRCSVFKREGFVTSPVQEHELRLCAVSQEISHALMVLTGVQDARVVLDVPEKNPLIDKASPPKASVVVKLRSGVDVDAVKSNIKRIVVHSVDGLKHDNVSVEHSVAEPTPSAAQTLASDTAGSFGLPWPLVLTFALGLVATLAALGLWWKNRQAGSPRLDAEPQAQREDAGLGDSPSLTDAQQRAHALRDRLLRQTPKDAATAAQTAGQGAAP